MLWTPRGRSAAAELEADELVAPELLDAEVLAVVRRWTHQGRISVTTAVGVLEGLRYWPVRRVAHVHLLQGAFALRDNYSAYDALYVVVAQIFGATILTCDGRLARAPRIPGVEVRNVVLS